MASGITPYLLDGKVEHVILERMPSPKKAIQIRKRLVQVGWLREHRVTTRRGGRQILLEILSAGLEALEGPSEGVEKAVGERQDGSQLERRGRGKDSP